MADTTAHVPVTGKDTPVLQTSMNALHRDIVSMAGPVRILLLDHSLVTVSSDIQVKRVALITMNVLIIYVEMVQNVWTILTILLAPVLKAGLVRRAITTLMNVL
jgi:hypothetical protein